MNNPRDRPHPVGVCFCLDFIMVSFPGKLIEIIR